MGRIKWEYGGEVFGSYEMESIEYLEVREMLLIIERKGFISDNMYVFYIVVVG